jgi:hypothetical protein
LGQSGFGSKFEDLSRNRRIQDFMIIGFDPLGVFADITIIEKLNRPGFGFRAVPPLSTSA